jgi:hypothetical protein
VKRFPRVTGFGRRELLAAAMLVPLIGCGASGGHAGSTTAAAAPDMASHFAELERKYEAIMSDRAAGGYDAEPSDALSPTRRRVLPPPPAANRGSAEG